MTTLEINLRKLTLSMNGNSLDLDPSLIGAEVSRIRNTKEPMLIINYLEVEKSDTSRGTSYDEGDKIAKFITKQDPKYNYEITSGEMPNPFHEDQVTPRVTICGNTSDDFSVTY